MSKQAEVRLMKEADIEGVLRVEHNAFQLPWTRQAFMNELKNNQFAHYLVAEKNGIIVGYCGVWIVIDEAHITNIAVHSSKRGRQIGDDLLIHALEMAYTYGAKTMSLEVRVSNEVAQALYDKHGFQPAGIRKNYYTDNNEDALVMWVNLHEQRRMQS
ncbi:ribosomal protein S18-alanine N-acetyltransferase [Alteribacillus sp. HJP-4]|uniref:ribosomal protein S18-alanine N-acetyltransferase n=1 Tax=Alteribacillus sp. HJP-4 TaxID=2775394 RepID=UPI0035CD1AE9